MIASFRNSSGRIISIVSRNYSKKLLAIKLQKMLDRHSAKQTSKKKQSPPLLLQKGTLLSAYDNEGSSRKVIALNKLYMEQIAVMINSGEFGRQLSDLGIEITRVKVASGMNFLNVYWIAKTDNVAEEVLNATLSGAVNEIQQNIGFAGFTTKAPLVRFVRDERLEMGVKLEKIFEISDFGKDFEPVYGKKVITPEFVPESRKFPVMRQNTLGLDHASIKARIEAQIIKFKTINTTENAEPPSGEMPDKLIQFNRKEFFKFYKRNRIMYLKLRKRYEEEHAVYGFTDEGEGDEYEWEDEEEYAYENEDEYEYEDEDRDENENKFQK